MVEDHKTDVTTFEAVAKTATDKDVKDFAAGTLPTLKEHLQMILAIAAKMDLSRNDEIALRNPATRPAMEAVLKIGLSHEARPERPANVARNRIRPWDV